MHALLRLHLDHIRNTNKYRLRTGLWTSDEMGRVSASITRLQLNIQRSVP
jgi:hypothetical protein